jgi:hypothetical protein
MARHPAEIGAFLAVQSSCFAEPYVHSGNILVNACHDTE